MRLPNLDPADVRSGNVVLWKYIDPWLGRCARAGDLVRLAQVLHIHIGTLRKRRRALGMSPLPPGRPKTTQLTAKQLLVVNSLKEGKTVNQIARATGTTPQSVSSARAKAEAKTKPDRLSCRRCNQAGVVECHSCEGIKSHFHMCPDCMGDGFVCELVPASGGQPS